MQGDVIAAYLAGLVDGEGYVGIKKVKPTKGRVAPGYHARIQVRMVSEDAIEYLATELAGRYYRENRYGVVHGRPLYCYQASDAKAELVLRRLVPFMRVKKINALQVLMFRDLQTTSAAHRTKLIGYREFQGFRGGMRRVKTMGLSDEYLARCEALYLECKRLNHA